MACNLPGSSKPTCVISAIVIIIAFHLTNNADAIDCKNLNEIPYLDVIVPPVFELSPAQEAVDASRSMYNTEIDKNLILAGIYDENDEANRIIIQAGISMANGILRASETLKNARLIAANLTLNPDDSAGSIDRVCQLMSCGVVALIGPKSDVNYRTLNFLASRFGMPFLDTYPRSLELPMSYSYKMYPDNESIAKAIVHFITLNLKWTEFTLFYDSSQNLAQLSPLLSMYESRIKLSLIKDTIDPSLRELFNSENKQYLVHLPYWKVNDFLIMAYAFNMTGEQYEYFFTDLDTNLLDLRAFQIDDGPKIYSFSLIDEVKQANIDDKNVKKLKNYIINYVRVKKGVKINGITTQAALVYDSILLLAEGLVELSKKRVVGSVSISCEKNNSRIWSDGLSLLNSMRSVERSTATKITGNISFNEFGSRNNMSLILNKLYIDGFKRFAKWENKGIKMVKQKAATTNRRKSKQPMLRAVTMINQPFVISHNQDAYGIYKENPESWSGFTMDMLKEIAKLCDFNYTVKTVTSSNGLINSLKNNESDLAVSSLTITYQRSLEVDFTTPYMSIGGGIIMRKPDRQKPHLFSFLSPLSPNVWVYVILAYILVSMSLFTIARLSNNEWQNPHPCDEDSPELRNPFTLLSSFWFYVGALVNQGTEMAPHSTSSRMLTGIWWFFTLIVISTYTANLAAFLTVENRKSPIESVDDLVKQTKIKYGTQGQGSTYSFFVDSNMTLYKKIGEYLKANKENLVDNADTGIKRTLTEDYAFILESSFSEYYSRRYCNLTQVGGNLGSKGYGIGLQKNSIWTDRITDAILELKRNGRLNSLKKKWWDSQDVDNTCSDSKEAKSLGVEQVGGVFIMLIIGFCMSFIVAMIEFYSKARRNLQGKQILNAMWKELKFAMRCLTSSKKPKPEVNKNTGNYQLTNSQTPIEKDLATGLIPIYSDNNDGPMFLGPKPTMLLDCLDQEGAILREVDSFEEKFDGNLSESYSDSSCCMSGENVSTSPCKGQCTSSYDSQLINPTSWTSPSHDQGQLYTDLHHSQTVHLYRPNLDRKNLI